MAVPLLAFSIFADHQADAAAVPGRCRPGSMWSTGFSASRSQASGWSAPSSASRTRPHRFAKANADLTDTATSVGRSLASIFPIVMFILNVSSVAVLWFGAKRIDAGEMQIGSLTAFLTYLIQILMSVMMATFLLMIAPRAAVCAERIQEVLDTESSVVPPPHPVTELSATGARSFRGHRVHLPGPTPRCCATSPSPPSPARRPRSSAPPAPARPP